MPASYATFIPSQECLQEKLWTTDEAKKTDLCARQSRDMAVLDDVDARVRLQTCACAEEDIMHISPKPWTLIL